MELTDRKIDGSTYLKDFPEKYNKLIDDLVTEINGLNNLVSSKDTEIQNLRTQLISLQSNLKADFSTWFDQKMSKFEETFDQKMSKFEETFVKSSDVYSKEQIDDLFITKTEADNTFVKKTNN